MGSKNRAPQFKNYNPRRWHPEFDLMVVESIAGKSNEEIGKLFGYTKEHVSNILSTQEAAVIRDRVRETINKEFDGKLKERLASIGAKCIQKIENFVEDERNLESVSPFMFIDRVVKIAQSTSTLVNNERNTVNNNTVVNGNAMIINNDQANGLRDALSKSMDLDLVAPGDGSSLNRVIEEPKQLRAG